MQLYYTYMQKIIQKSALHLFSHSSVAWEEAHEYPELCFRTGCCFEVDSGDVQEVCFCHQLTEDSLRV